MISFIWGLQSSVDYLGNYLLTDQSIFLEEQKKLRGKWSWQKVQFDQRKMCHHSSLIHWDVLSLNDATQHQSDEVAIVTKNYRYNIYQNSIKKFFWCPSLRPEDRGWMVFYCRPSFYFLTNYWLSKSQSRGCWTQENGLQWFQVLALSQESASFCTFTVFMMI